MDSDENYIPGACMSDFHERVHADPSILNGKPVIKGTRISVELILYRMAEGASINEMLDA